VEVEVRDKCVAGINREGLGKAKIVRNNGNECTTKFYVIFKILATVDDCQYVFQSEKTGELNSCRKYSVYLPVIYQYTGF